jgi:hypothetical protein
VYGETSSSRWLGSSNGPTNVMKTRGFEYEAWRVFAVELVGRYSNPNEWGHLTDTTLALAEPAVNEASDVMVVAPCSRRPWPVVDRLGDETIQQLLRDRVPE